MSLASNRYRWRKACARGREQRTLAPGRFECKEHGLFDVGEELPGDGCPICGRRMEVVR